MNLQLVYRCNLSLSKNENMFEKKIKIKKKKLGKQKQNDQKEKNFLPRKSNPRPKCVSSTRYL